MGACGRRLNRSPELQKGFIDQLCIFAWSASGGASVNGRQGVVLPLEPRAPVPPRKPTPTLLGTIDDTKERTGEAIERSGAAIGASPTLADRAEQLPCVKCRAVNCAALNQNVEEGERFRLSIQEDQLGQSELLR